MEAAGKSIYSVRRIGGFMVKAKDFWNILCNDLDYRFFAGVATSELKPLYKAMNADIMHYVPAVDEITALGIVSGAYIAGYKSGIIIDLKFVPDLCRYLVFNNDFNIPVLIIGQETESLFNFNKLPVVKIKKEEDIAKGSFLAEKNTAPVIMVIGTEVLK
jgi:hypothetical protein